MTLATLPIHSLVLQPASESLGNVVSTWNQTKSVSPGLAIKKSLRLISVIPLAVDRGITQLTFSCRAWTLAGRIAFHRLFLITV